MDTNLNSLKIKNLISSQQVVCKNSLISNYKDFNPSSYRFLEKPLAHLLTDDLISGSWTVDELADKYGIQKSDIRPILMGIMGDYSVFDGGYIPRRTGRNENEGRGSSSRYSLIPIPFKARIFDPTLGFSLLNWKSLMDKSSNSILIHDTEDVQKTYCENISQFWNIPLDKIKSLIENCDSRGEIKYFNTVYGPIPVLNEIKIYENIKFKIREDPILLSKRFNRRNLDKDYLIFNQYFEQGTGSLPELQYIVVSLYDILTYINNKERNSEYERFQEINEKLFEILNKQSEVRLDFNSNIEQNNESLLHNSKEKYAPYKPELPIPGLKNDFKDKVLNNKYRFSLGNLEIECLINDLKNQDKPNYQIAAARELGKSYDIRAPQILTEALEFCKPDIQIEIIDALRILNNPDSIPDILPFLNSYDDRLKKVAGYALVKLGYRFSETENSIQKNPLHEIRNNITEKKEPIKNEQHINDNYINNKYSVRLSIVQNISSNEPEKEDILIQALKDESKIQIEALDKIYRFNIHIPEDELIYPAFKGNEAVREKVIKILGLYHNEKSFSVLEKIVEMGYTTDAKKSIDAIIKYYPEKAIESIIKIVSSKCIASIKTHAIQSLENLPQCNRYLIYKSAFENRASAVKIAAIDLIAKFPDENSMNILYQAYNKEKSIKIRTKIEDVISKNNVKYSENSDSQNEKKSEINSDNNNKSIIEKLTVPKIKKVFDFKIPDRERNSNTEYKYPLIVSSNKKLNPSSKIKITSFYTENAPKTDYFKDNIHTIGDKPNQSQKVNKNEYNSKPKIKKKDDNRNETVDNETEYISLISQSTKELEQITIQPKYPSNSPDDNYFEKDNNFIKEKEAYKSANTKNFLRRIKKDLDNEKDYTYANDLKD